MSMRQATLLQGQTDQELIIWHLAFRYLPGITECLNIIWMSYVLLHRSNHPP